MMYQLTPEQRAAHDAVLKGLTDRGLLMEAGFVFMRRAIISPQAPQVQVDEMRFAFMAGAQHLFATMMSTLDPGHEPTDDDLRRMGMIDAELRQFAEQAALRAAPAGGNG